MSYNSFLCENPTVRHSGLFVADRGRGLRVAAISRIKKVICVLRGRAAPFMRARSCLSQAKQDSARAVCQPSAIRRATNPAAGSIAGLVTCRACSLFLPANLRAGVGAWFLLRSAAHCSIRNHAGVVILSAIGPAQTRRLLRASCRRQLPTRISRAISGCSIRASDKLRSQSLSEPLGVFAAELTLRISKLVSRRLDLVSAAGVSQELGR